MATTTTPADLPDSIEALRALVHQQQSRHAAEIAAYHEQLAVRDEQLAKNEAEIARHQEKVEAYSEEVSQLLEMIRLLKSQRFGSSSERSDARQPGLFNEAEACAEAAEEEAADDETLDVAPHKRRRGGRKPIPDALPREEILHDLEEHEKVCGNDPSHALRCIGEERSERVVYRPAELYVEVHVRPKYACGRCKDAVACAPVPPSPIPKSLATPSLLAQIITGKFVDGMPLARQEKMLDRIGFCLPRSTMASWMIRCAELAKPVTDLLLEGIRAGDHVLADETRFQVLKEDGKRAQSESYLWALRREDPEHPLLYYEYAPTREGEVVERLLEGFQGFLHTDGYSGYDGMEKKSRVVRVGCFAHARRKFDEALRGQSKKTKSNAKHRIAEQGLSRINALFREERKYRDATAEERHGLRQEILKPLIEDLETWTQKAKDRVPPQSLTGKAIAYLEHQWPRLVHVLDDGRLELSTNAIERAIRPFVIGRRGWLFADTPRGATASARLYSLVETAKANGLEPFAYLECLLTRLPLATCRGDYEALLPGRIQIEATRRPRSPQR